MLGENPAFSSEFLCIMQKWIPFKIHRSSRPHFFRFLICTLPPNYALRISRVQLALHSSHTLSYIDHHIPLWSLGYSLDICFKLPIGPRYVLGRVLLVLVLGLGLLFVFFSSVSAIPSSDTKRLRRPQSHAIHAIHAILLPYAFFSIPSCVFSSRFTFSLLVSHPFLSSRILLFLLFFFRTNVLSFSHVLILPIRWQITIQYVLVFSHAPDIFCCSLPHYYRSVDCVSTFSLICLDEPT